MATSTSNPEPTEDHRGDQANADAPEITADTPTGADAPAVDIPVVGIGASAGGLDAFRRLLAGLRPDTGMAFVLIQHLAPSHESLLPQLLQADAPMPVVAVRDGMSIEANRVYVIAPGQQLHLLHNRLQSIPEDGATRPFHPIDNFLSSLAVDRSSKAIGVILSGTATDGTLGCRHIKEAGGITFAQDRDSAAFPSMPANAIAAGVIDFELAPTRIARELNRLAGHPILTRPSIGGREPMLPISLETLNKILILLRSRTGHDFSHYKDSTIRRRISRRVLLHKLDSAEHYVRLLQQDAAEAKNLLQDLLINVTGFFRDPDGFNALEQIAFPALLEGRDPLTPLRIWVPGCSTGQEIYSIAILLQEHLESRTAQPRVQLFGSDIDEEAIDAARKAIYPTAIENEVTPTRLKRWFRKVPGGYQVSPELRESCIFATQSVARDPPFSRLDLVSCRNLLIYFEAVLQGKVLQLLHYALEPDGFLLLGSSESIGARADLFALRDKAGKLYRKKGTTSRSTGDLVFRMDRSPPATDTGRGREPAVYDLDRVAEQRLIAHFAPVGVIIGPDQRILRFFGRCWPYVEHSAGTATLNLYKLVHPDLLLELRAAIHSAGKTGADVRKANIKIRVENELRRVTIQVIPLGGAIRSESNLIVLFEPTAPAAAATPAQATPSAEAPARDAAGAAADDPAAAALCSRIAELERELGDTRDYMQSIIEEQEGFNEELRSANEEVQSTNEELQSANEELETAKEELQSANEELATVNVELENRNEDLARSNNDLTNLLASVNLPILILDSKLRVRQFTRPAERLLNLIDGDIGRPIGNINPNIALPGLEHDVLEVIETMTLKEQELRDDQGRWYSVRFRPYRTLDNRIDGAILLFIDLDDVKHVERLEQALAEERRLATVVRDANDAITVHDLDGSIRAWNPAATRIYGYTEDEALGMNVRQFVDERGQPQLEAMLADIRAGQTPTPVTLERLHKDGHRLRVLLSASILVNGAGQPVAVATTERPQIGPANRPNGV